jgi:hypothetical protein
MVPIRDDAEAPDHPPNPPAEATAMLFPLETFAELIDVAMGGLKVPMGHDGLILRTFAPGKWFRTRMRGRVAVEKKPIILQRPPPVAFGHRNQFFRRRRSSPAVSSNPAIAEVGSGTADQERVLPDMVKAPWVLVTPVSTPLSL